MRVIECVSVPVHCICEVVLLLAIYVSLYLFLVSMGTIMNNAGSKYQ